MLISVCKQLLRLANRVLKLVFRMTMLSVLLLFPVLDDLFKILLQISLLPNYILQMLVGTYFSLVPLTCLPNLIFKLFQVDSKVLDFLTGLPYLIHQWGVFPFEFMLDVSRLPHDILLLVAVILPNSRRRLTQPPRVGCYVGNEIFTYELFNEFFY